MLTKRRLVQQKKRPSQRRGAGNGEKDMEGSMEMNVGGNEKGNRGVVVTAGAIDAFAIKTKTKANDGGISMRKDFYEHKLQLCCRRR